MVSSIHLSGLSRTSDGRGIVGIFPSLTLFFLTLCAAFLVMFKRVTKKEKKRVEEEELGLDDDMKEILGMHDTDSDESDSDSDSESGNSDDLEDEEDEEEAGGRTRKASADDDSEDDEDGESDGDAEEGPPPLSVQEATKNPVYTISLDPDVRGCIVCPGKLLKNNKMVELHVESVVRLTTPFVSTSKSPLTVTPGSHAEVY